MKNFKLLLAILLIPIFSQAQLAYLNNDTGENKNRKSTKSQKEVAAPKFLPKHSMDQYVDFDFKISGSAINLKWQLAAPMQNKTVHLLKGVMNENHQIKWKIVEEFGPLNKEEIKFKFKDKTEENQRTYYRLRFSEDGDMVEYTGFYKVI